MSDAQQQKMAQMAQMMQQMAGEGEKNSKVSSNSIVTEGETKAWSDGRMNGRFSKPHGKARNQPIGQDPFKKFLHKSNAKKAPMDLDDVQTALFQPGIYDSNFHPLHETMSHLHWSDAEKVQVLKKCILFGPDVNQRNNNQKTPLEQALHIKDSKFARIAAMSLIEHGADLNTLDKDGMKALHHAVNAGHPEIIPAMIARQATAGKTAGGASLSQLALERFTRSMADNISNNPVQFETALQTYYKSMACVKRYKLYQGEFSMADHRKELLDTCKKQPGHRIFIDDVEKKISTVQPGEPLPKAQQVRPYTNPGHGYNYEIQEGNDAHAWLGGFSALMTKWSDKLNKDNYFTRSKNRITELLNKPELINNINVIDHLRKERNDIDIDYVLTDIKLNPTGDTLLTKLAKTANVKGISTLVEMHANLNAQDFNGNTAMHLLVENCKDKKELLTGLKYLVGVPNAEGKLSTLGGGDNYADRDIVNSQGQTFMDVLQEKHPEWTEEFSVELGTRPLQSKLPELEIARVLMLEGPDGILRLEKNLNPYLLMDETIPTVGPLSSVATEEERSDHVNRVVDALIKTQVLKTTASFEKVQDLNNGAEKLLNEQTVDTRMQACILCAQDKKPDSYKLNAQAMLLHDLADTMRNGTDDDRRLLFDTFEKTDGELQFRVTALMKDQSLFMGGEASALGEEDQVKFNASVSNLQTAATSFQDYMAAHAQNKYAITNFDVKAKNTPTSDTPKPDTP